MKSLLPALALGSAVLISTTVEAQAVRRAGPPPPDRVALTEATDVEMTKLGGRPVVLGTINGSHEHPILIDTGAGATVIDFDLVERFGLPVSGLVRVGSPTGGEPQEGQLTRFDSMTFGGVIVEGLTVIAMDLQTVFDDETPPIVMSPAMLAGMTLAFDYPAGRVRVAEGSLPAEGSFGYGDMPPFPVVPVALGEREFEAVVDTGAGNGLGLPLAWRDELALAGEPVLSDTPGRTVSGSFDVFEATLAAPARIGVEEYDGLEIRLVDGLSLPTLGAQILDDYVFTIDPANRRHTLERTR